MSEDRSTPPSASQDGGGTRLPPPAFPQDRDGRSGARPASGSGGGVRPPGDPEGISDDAFIPPDAPIVRNAPPRKPEDFEQVMRRHHEVVEPVPGAEEENGEAASDRGDDGADALPARPVDPAVADLVARVGELADALRDRGEAGLRTSPEMSRFEATLRAYCVGYLAGLRRGG